MNRRSFLVSAAALPLATTRLHAAAVPAAAVSPAAAPMHTRYALTLDRVLHGTGPAYTPDFLLEDIRATPGRRFTNYSGDVSGRWIGALATAAATYHQHFPQLDEVVSRTLALQHPEGYFGATFHFDAPTDHDLALLWGNGRLLTGLMEYHALTRYPAVLASAIRLGDFLLRIAPQFNSQSMADAFNASHFASSYICWTQQTEGLAALYAATRDQKYATLCAEISRRTVRRPSDHVHGYLCSLRGTLALYNETHDPAMLQLVETAWHEVTNSGDILLTGGVPEAWSPNKKRTEGCAEADWLRLNLALHRATAKPEYLEAAERILFNDFAMNQFSTGDFGHAVLNAQHVPEKVTVRAWWCCTLHGLRTFPDIQNSAFRPTPATLFFDLPVDATTASASSTSRLAQDGTVTIEILHPTPSLTVRRPAWAAAVTLTHNAHPTETLTNLQPGDHITIHYAMQFTATPFPKTRRTSFSHGPWLLGAAQQADPAYFNEMHPENLLDPASAQPARAVPSPFAVPIATTSVAYIPAEFPEQPTRITLRPIAEQTAMLPTPWELTFLTNPK